MVGVSILIIFGANFYTHELTPNSENNENLQFGWSFWAHFTSLAVSILTSRNELTKLLIHLKFYIYFIYFSDFNLCRAKSCFL
jgi:hypothetical protein